ncbi:MAG: hypothetical protein JWO38_4872 [Gemmataceae bacterium]|nr:hypothetical protein [Gemmataceae bacterium]
MTDPFAEVSPGQPIEIPARTWNQLMKAAQAYHRTRLGGQNNTTGNPLDFKNNGANLCLVQNPNGSGGAALPEWSVQGYGTPTIDMAPPNSFNVQRRPAFAGRAPTGPMDPICITIEPARGQGFARAVTSGLAVCQVKLSDPSHTRAVPVAGVTSYLQSAAVGGIPIIAHDAAAGGSGSGAGLAWALVLVGDVTPPNFNGGPPAGTAACGGEGFIAGATKYDCWTVTVYSKSGNMSGIPNQTHTLKWDGSGWTSAVGDNFCTCLSQGPMTLFWDSTTDDDPDLFISGLGTNPPCGGSGSGTGFTGTYHLRYSCADPLNQTLYFSGGNSGVDVICCANETKLGPAYNLFTVAVKWASCQQAVSCCSTHFNTASCTLVFTVPGGGPTYTWSGELTYDFNAGGLTALIPAGTICGCNIPLCVSLLVNVCPQWILEITGCPSGAIPSSCNPTGGGCPGTPAIQLFVPLTEVCSPNAISGSGNVGPAVFQTCPSSPCSVAGLLYNASITFDTTFPPPGPCGSGSGGGSPHGGPCGLTSSSVLHLTVSGSAQWGNGTYTSTYNATSGLWEFTVPGNTNNPLAFGFSPSSQYVLGYATGGAPWPAGNSGPYSCGPLSVTGLTVGAFITPGSGTMTITGP